MDNSKSGSPFPQLFVYGTAGQLSTVPWADYQPNTLSTSDIHTGPDGIGMGMTLICFWKDLLTILPQLIGYSYRRAPSSLLDPIAVTAAIKRVLPWQHPYMNQCFVKAVTKVQGGKMQGKNIVAGPFDLAPPSPTLGGVGQGYRVNTAPWTDFNVAFITVQFWRPPYMVRTDDDILDSNGNQREWLRYTSRTWETETQFLVREGMTLIAAPNQGLPDNAQIKGNIGQQVFKSRVTRRWYQIPEACIFSPAQDLTRQGLPYNQVYCRTNTTNPVTGYFRAGGAFNPSDSNALGGASGPPIGGCVNSPIGGGVRDNVVANRLFGCPMGTLLFVNAEYHPCPLQLPPYIMKIPPIPSGVNGQEAVSQVQYDVLHHFVVFDPPRADAVSGASTALPSGSTVQEAYRGHNLFPYPKDGMWYAWTGQSNVGGSIPGRQTTPFQYADLSDLYIPL